MNHLSGKTSIATYCPTHSIYYLLSCPQCYAESSPTYKRDVENLKLVHSAIRSFFSYPVIGEMTLDSIIESCLAFPQVAIYLQPYEDGSIPYYMARYKVVQMIKTCISSYIDGKLEPK